MARKSATHFSRREQQIMDIVYLQGQASVNEVLTHIPDPPSYSAVRALLRILEEKGHLKHKKEGPRYIYLPIRSRKNASRTALKRVVKTFFDNSVEKTVAALLDTSDTKLDKKQLDQLARLIDQAKKGGR